MELNEFHVRYHGSCAVGHGEAVAGGDIRVRRMEVYLSRAAGCEPRRPAPESAPARRREVPRDCPRAPPIHQSRSMTTFFVELPRGSPRKRASARALDHATGGIPAGG